MISALIRSNVVYRGVLPIGSNSENTDPTEEQPNLGLHFPFTSLSENLLVTLLVIMKTEDCKLCCQCNADLYISMRN